MHACHSRVDRITTDVVSKTCKSLVPVPAPAPGNNPPSPERPARRPPVTPQNVVKRQRQAPAVPEPRKPAHRLRNDAVELVPRQVQILNAVQAGEGQRDGTRQGVVADVEDRGFFQEADFVREIPGRCGPKVVREVLREEIVVDKDNVELEEESELGDSKRDVACEVVGVDVEERQLRNLVQDSRHHQLVRTSLRGESSSVEVQSRDHILFIDWINGAADSPETTRVGCLVPVFGDGGGCGGGVGLGEVTIGGGGQGVIGGGGGGGGSHCGEGAGS
ncbi:uncharacterized protein G2W53_003101 [Senna tora]|uniref:Uncharacterized protein n=1 Tax=Senna tora TaxID=362788 RepID=A0A834X8D0_9FABA|nr:uncharacterized protein G2W53_003101 [Senna tora]